LLLAFLLTLFPGSPTSIDIFPLRRRPHHSIIRMPLPYIHLELCILSDELHDISTQILILTVEFADDIIHPIEPQT